MHFDGGSTKFSRHPVLHLTRRGSPHGSLPRQAPMYGSGDEPLVLPISVFKGKSRTPRRPALCTASRMRGPCCIVGFAGLCGAQPCWAETMLGCVASTERGARGMRSL